MKQLQMKHWQDPVNALLGAWLIASPWVLNFEDNTAALANGLAVGVLLVAAALGAMFLPQAWEEWTEAGLGLWTIASPWLLGFAGHYTAMQNAAFTGSAVLLLALWVLATDKEISGWWKRSLR